jgi:hypothetical protein
VYVETTELDAYTVQCVLLLAVNLGLYTTCCQSDPGLIDADNEQSLLHAYEFDDVLHKKNSKCRTCKISKPARSKHCCKQLPSYFHERIHPAVITIDSLLMSFLLCLQQFVTDVCSSSTTTAYGLTTVLEVETTLTFSSFFCR